MGDQNLERNYVFITNSNLLIQNKNSVRSNNLGSKYQKFTPSGCRDLGIRKLKFVAKTQFLCLLIFVCLLLFNNSGKENAADRATIKN